MTEANKTVLILRNPGVMVPTPYLTRVLAACPNGGGYAIQTMTENGPALETDNSDTGASVKDIQDLIEAYKDSRMLLAFNKLETPKEHQFQPFHVAVDGDDVVLSYGIDGDFPKLVEAGHTEESLLAKQVMFPNLQKAIRYSGGDLDKFIAELRDPAFVDMVMARIGDRGSFCFLPPVGEAIWLGKNKARGTFPWGEVSNTLGYTEAPASATVDTSTSAAPKKGWWGKSKGPEVPVAQEPAPSVPQHPAPPPGPLNIPAAKPDTKVTPPAAPPKAPAEPPVQPTEVPKGTWKAVPKGLSKDQRKKLIRRVTNCGNQLPELWNVDPFWYFEVEYPKDERIAALIDKGSENPKTPKKEKAARVPQSGAQVDVLLMSRDERSAIETHILQTMNRVSKEVRDPLEIQKAEAAYAPFSQEFGVKLKSLDLWTPKELRLLGPKGMIHMLLEERRSRLNIQAALAGDTKTVADPAPDVKTEAPAPVTSSATEAPAKKGFWGKKAA